MKNRMTKRRGFKMMALILCTLMLGAFASCSGDDDGGAPTNPTAGGKNVKLTITINGADTNDYISFVAAGGIASNPSESTVWKVNGATLTNESAVSLDKNDFTGTTKTYIIESVAPLSAVSVGMQFLTFADRSYTISYKAEINGQIVKEENNIVVTENNDYTHDYSY